MKTLRVAGAQIPVTRDIGTNVETIRRAMDFAIREGADILLTPEGSLSGYTHEFDRKAVRGALDEITSCAMLPRGAGLALALGTCVFEPDDNRCYNEIRFYDSQGAFLGFHAKVLRCGSHEDPPKGEVSHFAGAPLRTFEIGGITVGGLICNDLWANPGCTPMPDTHLTQELSKMGARIVFHAVNGGRSASEWSKVAWQYHEANLRMRARAGKLWIVTVDNCAPMDTPCSAPSGVIGPEGNWRLKTKPKGEDVFVYTIELDA